MAASVLCQTSFLVSSTLYKGVFGSMWRASMGVWYLLFNAHEDSYHGPGITCTEKTFPRNVLFLVAWVAPMCLGIIIVLVFLVPLAVIFLPLF
jgi:hypothetical protein